MMTAILATLGVAYCSLWQWVTYDPAKGTLFSAAHLADLPADLRESAALILLVPMDIQSTPECMKLKEDDAAEHPSLGIERFEI